MLPGYEVQLSSTSRKRLEEYCYQELSDAFPAHTELEDLLEQNDRDYYAQSPTRRKTFPWPGAANLVIPLIGVVTDSIVARIVNTVFSVDPFWTINPLHKDMVDMAKPTQDFIEWSRKVEMDIYPEVKSACLEVVRDGHSWIKTYWDLNISRYFDGNRYQNRKITRPVFKHILLNDIVRQVGIEDEMQAEWIAHRVRFTDGQLRWRAAGKQIIGGEDLENILKQKDDTLEYIHRGTPSEGTLTKFNTMYEMHIDFPLKSERDLPSRIVVLFHYPSKTVMRCIHNPLFYHESPFTKLRFVEKKGKSDGLGIVEMLRGMQAELSTIHCQQLDNATLANTRFFLGKKNVVRDTLRIWPGRVVTVNNPKEDLIPMQLGEVYNSMQALEISVLSFAERRSGVSDYTLGRESSVVGNRSTATGTLAIIQEGNRRFDLNVRDLRSGLGVTGRKILELNQQFRPKGLAYFLQGEDGHLVEEVLNLPTEFIANKLGVEITASSATVNKQVEQQGLIALIPTLVNDLKLGTESLMYIQDPNIRPEAKEYIVKKMEGIHKLILRVVQTFDIKDADDVVGGLETMEGLHGLAREAQGIPGQPGGGAAPNGAGTGLPIPLGAA